MKGYIKINVDEATTSEGNMTACSGFMRDYKGEVKGSFLCNIGRGNSFLAETWVILMGLRWSWDFGVRHVLIESDCLHLVQDIEQLWDHDVEVQQEGVSAEVKEIISLCRRP